MSLVLDEICRISNIYEITPKQALNIYHSAIGKRYNNYDWAKTITHIERYISMNYKIKDWNKYK